MRTAAPNVDAGKQKQPHHVDEVPVPRREFKSEMLGRLELSSDGAEQTNNQEDRPDDHMSAMKARGHEKRGAVDAAGIVERRMPIFPRLHAGESDPQGDSKRQAPDQPLAIVVQQRVMRPGYRRTR